MTLPELRRQIWDKCKHDPVVVAVATEKAKVKPPLDTEDKARAVLALLNKPRKTSPKVPAHVKQRYNDAHKLWFQQQFPEAYADGHYTPPVFPKVHTSNGLQTFIVNLCTWMNCAGNRINTTGRQVNGKWIKGTTRKGTGDTMAVIKGRHVVFEVKTGRDKPSDKQLREQARIRAAGGEYYFTHTAEEFLQQFDEQYYG